MTGFCDQLDQYAMSDPVMSSIRETKPDRSETVRIKGI